MSEYAVLYHDPVRVSPDLEGSILAAQSVWVCRNDRYAFEVHVFGERSAVGSAETLGLYGEGRYRFALAILGGRHARRVAIGVHAKADPITVTVSANEIAEILESVPPSVAINFGDVIYRFRTAAEPRERLSRAAG